MQGDNQCLFPEECVLFVEGSNEGDSEQSYPSHDSWEERRRAGWRKRQGNEPRNRSQNAAKEEILKGGCCESVDPPSLKMAKRLNAQVRPTRTEKVRKGDKTKTREVPAPKKGAGRRLRELRESIRQAED